MRCSTGDSRFFRRWLASALLLSAGLVSRRVPAQTDTLAESLFRDARVAMRAGDPERACPLFEESYRLDPAFGTLFNLGACEEARGKLATAWALFRRLVDLAPDADERVIEARTRLNALEERVPRLRIVLLDPLPADQALELDGVVLGPGAREGLLRVDPGKHVLRVVAPGRPGRSVELEVAVGETLTYEVEPLAEMPNAALSAPVRPFTPLPPRRPAERTTPAESRTAAYVALGFGGAGVGASLVFGAVALRAHEITKTHCPGRLCDAEGMAAADRGAKFASLATASMVAGLAGLAAGGLLLWRASEKSVRVDAVGSTIRLKGAF
jgi:tetratricopeptide (TPR) repeat protein